MLYYRSPNATETAPLRPGRARLLTAVALVAYPLGCALALFGVEDGFHPIQASGLALCALAFFACVGFIGGGLQRIASEEARRLDERELELRRRAYAFAYQTFGALALLGVIYLAVASDARAKLPWLWLPEGYDAWNAVFWGACLYLFTLPTAYLAWTTKAEVEP